jgi:hypothetical protein
MAASAPSFGELFAPKLVTVLREGYAHEDDSRDKFANDNHFDISM